MMKKYRYEFRVKGKTTPYEGTATTDDPSIAMAMAWANTCLRRGISSLALSQGILISAVPVESDLDLLRKELSGEEDHLGGVFYKGVDLGNVLIGDRNRLIRHLLKRVS